MTTNGEWTMWIHMCFWLPVSPECVCTVCVSTYLIIVKLQSHCNNQKVIFQLQTYKH